MFQPAATNVEEKPVTILYYIFITYDWGKTRSLQIILNMKGLNIPDNQKRKSKNRLCFGQINWTSETQWSTNTTPKTKDWATWAPLITYVQVVQHHHANHYTTEVVFNNSFGALSYIIYNHAYFLWVFDLILIVN